jgi:quinol monooxygenase YgiN
MAEVVVVATLHARENRAAEFESELRKLFTPTHAEDGCLLFALHQSAQDPTVWCVIERWESDDHLERHLGSPHIQAYVAATADLLAEPIRIDRYRATPEGDPAKGRL